MSQRYFKLPLEIPFFVSIEEVTMPLLSFAILIIDFVIFVATVSSLCIVLYAYKYIKISIIVKLYISFFNEKVPGFPFKCERIK